MSKKKFKGGIDSLLQSTINNGNNPLSKTVGLGLYKKDLKEEKTRHKESHSENSDKKEQVIKEAIENVFESNINDEIIKERDAFALKIELLNQELMFWRTGKLTVEKFHDSLKNKNLVYNTNTNKIEPLIE
jgi:hypothetical protein